jgi:D-threo-aldose 1-dehydrogenase
VPSRPRSRSVPVPRGSSAAARTPAPITLAGRGGASLTLSPLSLGTTGLGNYPTALSEESAAGAVAAALASGWRMFDTAPLYGRGLAERRLGLALNGTPRTRFVIASKIGRLLVPCPSRRFTRDPGAAMFVDPAPFDTRFDYSYDATLRSIDDSLQRLGLTHVDIVHVHNIDPANHPGEKVERMFGACMDGAYRALDRLRAERVITAIGVGNNSSAMLMRFAHAGDFDCFLMAGQYNLLNQDALDGVWADARASRVPILLAGVFASGILATGNQPDAMFGYRPAQQAVRRRVRALEALCARHSVSLPALAIRFALAHPMVRTLVLGCVTAGQVIKNTAALRETIPSALWRDLRDSGLVDARCPLPGRG